MFPMAIGPPRVTGPSAITNTDLPTIVIEE